LNTLNQALKSKESFSIDPSNKNPQYYEHISKEYTKHKRLMALYNSNPSLEVFVHELQNTTVVPDADDLPNPPPPIE